MTSSGIGQQSGGHATEQRETESSRGSGSKLAGMLRRAAGSTRLAGIGGGLTLLSGFRALRRGQWGRGIVRLVGGGLLVAAAARRRRSSGERGGPGTGVDQQAVVDTSPHVEHVDDAGLDEGEHASADAAREVAESSVDIEDASDDAGSTALDERSADTASEGQVDFETAADEPQNRLGEGTFDEHRGVPVPEEAFEEGFFEVEDEVFWAIREEDDAVFLTHRRTILEDSEGVEYVTSSEVDDEQLLSVPEVVLSHWESVGDEAAMDDGDDLVFATTDDLRQEDVLWILTEHLADERSGQSERRTE